MGTRLKSTRVVTIDAALILVIAVTLVALNLYLLERTNSQLIGIDKEREYKLEQVSTMKSVIRDRSLVMVDMAMEKDVWAFDEKYLRFYAMAGDFIGARDRLLAEDLSEREKNALSEALSTVRSTEALQNSIVEKIRHAFMHDKSIESILHEISTNDLPVEFKLLGQMENLYDRIVVHANSRREAIKQAYQHTVLIVTVTSFVCVAIIVFLMVRALKKIRTIEMGLIREAENLTWDATHDPLTNIFNRRWLKYKIEMLNQSTTEENVEHSLICIDLDGFKAINDSYGHAAGDVYLVQFCREVEHTIRQNDTFCRLGGDEFAILLENCKESNSVKIANEVLDRISHMTVEHQGNRLGATCSIGVCSFSNLPVRVDALVQRADELCYSAKRKGKNQVETGSFT